MKQFSHAWLAFKAIERLEKADLDNNRQIANELIRWFWDHRDGVIQGAWYPDMVIKDMATSHVYKLKPAQNGMTEFRSLPQTSEINEFTLLSPVRNQPYELDDPSDNLPERCEALAHSVIDNFKMQEREHKGSPIAPTDNHIATRLFMLSHYIADAHMPLHCDHRKFSSGKNVHAIFENAWDKAIKKYYKIDILNERFYYNPEGYPLRSKSDYENSFLKKVEDEFPLRDFSIGYGGDNNNVRTYMLAVCQNSYLLSYAFTPPGFDEANVNTHNWDSLPGQLLDFEELSRIIFIEAIDAIARVWFRVWRRYQNWLQ